MEKHANITIDFCNLNGPKKDLRIPLHLTSKDLISNLVEIYNLEAEQDKAELQSFKAQLSKKFISGKESLLDANIMDGEILVIIK